MFGTCFLYLTIMLYKPSNDCFYQAVVVSNWSVENASVTEQLMFVKGSLAPRIESPGCENLSKPTWFFITQSIKKIIPLC